MYMVLRFTCVVAVDERRRTGLLEQGSCGGSTGTWANTFPLPWGLGDGGKHGQKPVFNSQFWNSQQILYDIIKFGFYLQDLGPVLQASETVLHFQTEGWPFIQGKGASRSVLFRTSALLSNASSDTHQLFRETLIPSPAQMMMASLLLELKQITACGSTEVNLLQNSKLTRKKRKKKSFSFCLLGCCFLPTPLGTLPQAHCRESKLMGLPMLQSFEEKSLKPGT